MFFQNTNNGGGSTPNVIMVEGDRDRNKQYNKYMLGRQSAVRPQTVFRFLFQFWRQLSNFLKYTKISFVDIIMQFINPLIMLFLD